MQYNHLKALLVDDDEVVQLLVGHSLNSIGIESVVASSGDEAITALNKRTFDFIIMDISMPGQDGIDSVRWIRDILNPEKNDLPIFALTNFHTPRHTEEILKAGFNEHIIKPFDIEEFKNLLHKYFYKKIN